MELAVNWNPAQIFPSLESSEFKREFEGAVADLKALERDFPALTAHGADLTASLETLLTRMNALLEKQRLLVGYLTLFITTDSRNDAAQAKMSELETRLLPFSMLYTRFAAWVGRLEPSALNAALEANKPGGSEVVRSHAFFLDKTRLEAQHLMSVAEEDLATQLSLSGGSAWSKLHGNLTSQMMVNVNGESLPMTAVRNLARDEDEAVRKSAYTAELDAWKGVEVTLAAALNGIKGERAVLNARRGYTDSLEPALHMNNMDLETLEAMIGAVEDALPDFRRYFKAKARLLGKAALPWFDLFAPIGESKTQYDYPLACEFVIKQFGKFSNRMAEFAARAVDEGWMDVYPREGKIGGAFCMELRGDESRILLNHDSSLDSVMTLAHELGHAYHNLNLVMRTPLQQQIPMTLAETASTFCEAILSNAALEQAEGAERLYILETQLQGHAQIVVDILSRYYFETAVFGRRVERDLSPDEFSNLMLECQKRSYGDSLDPQALHPYMWAVKGHYYMAGLSFYNFPYTFGALFSLGLYAEYLREPELFRARYDDLLSSTGLEDAAPLAARFGMDIRSKSFWKSSLDVIISSIDEYEKISLGG